MLLPQMLLKYYDNPLDSLMHVVCAFTGRDAGRGGGNPLASRFRRQIWIVCVLYMIYYLSCSPHGIVAFADLTDPQVELILAQHCESKVS